VLNAEVKRRIKSSVALRPLLAAWFGTKLAKAYFLPQALGPYVSVLRNGELGNFTYDLTNANLRYLAETVSVVTGKAVEEIVAYIAEVDGLPYRFGRRIGWYAIARAIKPKLIVETGIERGHGALLLSAALKMNANDGHSGRYIGTDIDPAAGQLLTNRAFGEILYGDSIESLRTISTPIDLFINDSDHSADYEAAEYRTIKDKLSSRAIILGDNAHVTDKLALFARETDRRFLFFAEKPKDHWYPGGGIGIAYRV